MNFDRLKFRFGFLICRSGEPGRRFLKRALPSAAWQYRSFAGFEFWTHPETRVAVVEGSGRTLVFLGDVYDSGTGTVPDLAPEPGESALLDMLDRLGGRFALTVIEGDRARILHDAIGSRALYYHAGPPFAIASHAPLLAKALGEGRRPEVSAHMANEGYLRRRTRYLPGDWTLYNGIYGLAPNNLYDSATSATSRYWPRAPLAKTRFDDLATAVNGHFAGLIDFVRAAYAPVIGLTGGADCRLALAAFKAQGAPFETVTWKGRVLNPSEVPSIERISARLGAPHRYLGMPRPIAEVARIARRNGGNQRQPSRITSAMYASFLQEPTKAFVRCWGAEVMRGYYNTRSRPMRHPSPAEMSRLYRSDPGSSRLSAEERGMVNTAFEDFFARANYDSVERFGHDPNDLFYWEHRMGTWGAAANNELDAAMPTLIGMNSRPLFEAAFGLPPERRFSKRLFLELIDRYDPVLARIPLAPAEGNNRVSLDEVSAKLPKPWVLAMRGGESLARLSRKLKSRLQKVGRAPRSR